MLPIQNLPPLQLTPAKQETTESKELTSNFSQMLGKLVNEVAEAQHNSNSAVKELHAGGEKNLHEVMIAMEQADISLRYLVQVRNKALEAYQEISRLQV